MIRRLVWIAAIAFGITALLRIKAHRDTQRADDTSARADWESEGGASAAAPQS
jgi:hypothetical protein